MAIHSSILAWEISRTEEPGGLQSIGSQSPGSDTTEVTSQARTSQPQGSATHIAGSALAMFGSHHSSMKRHNKNKNKT